MPIDFRSVPVDDVLPLRHAILARGDDRPPTATIGDRDDRAYHVAGFQDDAVVAVGSIHPEPMPGSRADDVWRLTGVAVEHGHRGSGLGAAAVERCLEYAASQGAIDVWCRVPASAHGFFERYGFHRTGDPVADGGEPAYLMRATVGPRLRSWSLGQDTAS